MEFKKIMNPVSPEASDFDLTDKEIAYIAMLIADAPDDKIKLLAISKEELELIYKKFGLTDERFDRDIQLASIAGINKIINEDILMKVYEKYDVIECKEMIEKIKKAPKYGKKYFQQVNDVMTSVYDKVRKEMD